MGFRLKERKCSTLRIILVSCNQKFLIICEHSNISGGNLAEATLMVKLIIYTCSRAPNYDHFSNRITG